MPSDFNKDDTLVADLPDFSSGNVATPDFSEGNTPDPTLGEKVKSALGAIPRGAVDVAASLPESIAIAARKLDRRVLNLSGIPDDAPLSDRGLFQLGQWMREKTADTFPKDPRLADSFWAEQVPSGIGSTIGFLGTGLGLGAARNVAGRVLTRKVAETAAEKALQDTVLTGTGKALEFVAKAAPIAASGAMVNAVQGYKDALAKGADEDTAIASFVLNGVGGVAEAAPIQSILNRINRSTGGGISKAIRGILSSGAEELIQESGQQALGNVIAQNLYDHERETLEGVAAAGGAGGITGVLLSLLGIGGKRLLRGSQPQTAVEFQDPVTGQWLSAEEYSAATQPPPLSPEGFRVLGGGRFESDDAPPAGAINVSSVETGGKTTYTFRLPPIKPAPETKIVTPFIPAVRPEDFLEPTAPRPPVEDYVESDLTEKVVRAEEFIPAIISRGRFQPSPQGQATGRPHTVTSAPTVAQPATVETTAPGFQSAIRVRGETYTGQAHALALVKAEKEIGSIDQSEIELGWLKDGKWHDIERNPEGSPDYKPYSQAERMGNIAPPVPKQSLTTETPAEVRGEVKASELMTPGEAVEALHKPDSPVSARDVHKLTIQKAFESQKPVDASAADVYGLKPPQGYVREGDRYVYKPGEVKAESKPVTPPTIPSPAPIEEKIKRGDWIEWTDDQGVHQDWVEAVITTGRITPYGAEIPRIRYSVKGGGYVWQEQNPRKITPPKAVSKPATEPQSPVEAKLDDIQKRREEIKARLRKKLGQTNIAVDPEIATIAAELAVNYAEEGIVRFSDFASRVKAELPDIWERLKHYLGGAWRTAGEQNMDLDETTRAEAKTVIDGLDVAEQPSPDKKASEEAVEIEIIRAAREVIATTPDPAEAFRKLVALYQAQPRLGTRTVTSKTNQAYSTPAPLAYLAGRLADLQHGTQIAEPTAGNGMLFISAPESAGWLANELDPARNERLKQTFRRAIMSQMDASSPDFHDYLTQMKPDRAVMNPPFGGVIEEGTTETRRFPIINASTQKADTPSIDLAIALNTLDALTPNGKAVVIIGAKTGSMAAHFGSDESRAKAYNRPEMLEFFKRFNVVDWFTVDGSLYEKMGAGWPVDVIVIDGKRPTLGSAQGGLVRPWVKPPPVFETWESLEPKLYETERRTAGTTGRTPGGSSGGIDVAGGERGSTVGPPRITRGPRNSGASIRPMAEPQRPSEPKAPIVETGGPVVVPEMRSEQPAGSVGVGSPAGQSDEVGEGIAPLVERATVLNVPYVSVSKAADPKLVVPANIADAMRRAVQKLETEVGKTVDNYVAEKMGWTVPELYKHLSSTQIETVALFIRNSEARKTGLIDSSQTGVGKGRSIASIIEYARRNGKTPIFITQGKHLYSDMAGRDLPSIGVKDFLPFITDSNFSYLNGSEDEVAEKHDAKDRRALMQEFGQLGALPAKFDGIFTTYYQLQADKPENWSEKPDEQFKRKKKLEARPDGARLALLRKLAPNAIFILDEAHQAAGLDSDVGLSMQSILKSAAGVFYASATFAKRPDNLTLYSLGTGLKLAGLSPKEMAELFKGGGVPMQQALTAMLAEEGEFVRREQDMKDVDFDFTPVSHSPIEEAEKADTYTQFLRDLYRLSDMVNTTAEAAADDENQVLPEDSQVDLTSVDFGARLFNLSSQYLFSLRAESAVKEAVAALKRGQKPFIAVYNTMAGPISDLVTRQLPLNFGGLLRREMAKMLVIKIKDPSAPSDPVLGLKKGERLLILKPEDLPDGGAFYRQVEEQIKSTDFSGMPISPIDYIKKGITQAGYSIGEITAREGEVDESGATVVLSKRAKRDRNKILHDYNHGVLDAVIVNGSGSTGLSAHSDPKFKDQRQRYMIVAQAAPDINVFMQMIGRVMRFGQTSLPAFKILVTHLAAERRFMTMLRGKLTSLNANTSADTESGVTQGGLADDIFNQIGDEIVAEVILANPEAAALARIEPGKDDEDGGIDNYARYATGRFVLLPNDVADQLWNDISETYNSRIRALDEAGENPLKANVQDLRATITGTSIIEASQGKTAFDGPVTLDRVTIQPGKKPHSYQEASAIAESSADDNWQKYQAWLAAQKVAASERITTMERREMTPDQIDRTRVALQKTEQDVITAFSLLGKVVAIDPTGSGNASFYAVPVGIELRSKGTSDFSSSSKHTIKLATNMLRRTINLPLSQLASLTEVDSGVAEFSFNDNSESTTTRYIAGTNLLRAYSVAAKLSINTTKPAVTIYTMRNGQLKTGVLMGAAFNPTTVSTATRRQIVTADEFEEEIRFSVPLTAGLVKITGNEVRLPSGSVTKSIWGDRQFVNFFLRDPVERNGEFRGNLDARWTRSFFEFLSSKGQKVFAQEAEGEAKTIEFTEPEKQYAAQQQGASTVQQVTTEALAFLGVQKLPASITVIFDPSKPFAAVITNRNTITLNAAKIRVGEVGEVLLEEGMHGVWFQPEVQSVMAAAHKAVTQTDIQAERAKRSGLDTDEATLIEEATISKLLNRSFWNRLLDALKRAFRRLFGIEINPNSYEGLREAAMAFLRGERGNLPGKRLIASNAVVVAPGMSPAYAITAHHGTPHEVDKFSTEKIGTGEGAQVYGWGLYMAQNPEVANAYRKNLSKYNGYLSDDDVSTLLQVGSDVWPQGVPRNSVRDRLENKKAVWADVLDAFSSYIGEDEAEQALRSIAAAWRFDTELNFGQTYTVTLNVEQDELLDWDLPLSEQSEKVRKILEQAGVDPALNRFTLGNVIYRALEEKQTPRPDSPDGDGWGDLQYAFKGPQAASEYLVSLGIKGIRYLDQESRGKSIKDARSGLMRAEAYLKRLVDGGIIGNLVTQAQAVVDEARADLQRAENPTFNFVIFNSDDITITHRNGQPVTVEEAMGDEVRYAAPTVAKSESEALNSKAFKANAELADDLGTIRPEDDEEGVRTKVGNVHDQVLSRPGLNNAVKADSVANAQNALAEAGLVVAQADDGLFELVDNAASQEQGGQNLVTILEREIQSARAENRPDRIANLLNTVVVHLARDKNQAFSQATKNRLYALAQGERSAFGRALGSLAMWGKVLANVAQNPSLHLNRIYSQNLGGEELSEVMRRLREILGGSPTEQEIEDALAKVQAEFSKKNRLFDKGNKLWGKIQKAARAGLFDPGPILEDLARSQGWTVPTEGQKAWLRDQVAEEERLRTPTQRQIDNAGGDIDKATAEAAKGTESDRLKIIKDIQAHWSRWSMPISWNPFKWTAQTMRNNARAVNEFVAANFLFTPGFPVRQWMDVILTSLPLNAVNRTLVHVLERAQNDGGFSTETTKDLYAASEEMLVSRIASLKATIRAMERTAGGHLNRKVLERMTHSVGVFERMRVKANELKANGNLAGYWALRFASILQAGYRVASVFDESQATGLEWQEMRQQLATDLRAQGKSRAEISTQLDDILGGIRVDMMEAIAEVTAIKQERGLPLNKKAIEQDAWALIKARAYDRMRQVTGTGAQYETENTQLRELHSWNLPETGGIGGAVAGTINFIKRYTQKAGIPTGGLFSFGNAMGIAANRMATFSGGGLFGGFGFGDSPWYQGDRNIKQRRIEAIEGLAVMGLMVALAAAGKILIMTRYPDDKDEKERFIAEGHKLNTVRFIQDDGKWLEYPIQMSPFSFIASPLYMIGGIQRLLINQQKTQERLNVEAAKTGATPGQAKTIGPGDVAGVIAQGMYGMLTGGRTATGAIQSFSDYGDFNLNRASSSLVRGYIPGVPAWQTVSRMMGVAMDSKTASVFEQLFPVPGSQHQRVNSLGDPMTNANDAVRVLQVLTAGVGFGSEADRKNDYAYRQLFAANYSAPLIGRNKGYNFGSTIRPMTPKEFERYTVERGKAFKQELEQLGSLDGQGSGEARKAAQGAFQRANQRALANIGVSEIKPKRAYTRRLRSVGGITRRGRQTSLGRIRRGSIPSFGKLRPARSPRIKRAVLSGTRKQRVQRIVPANY